MSVPAHEQVGYTFASWKTMVDDERQARFHKAVAINSILFGDTVDVSVLSNDCLHEPSARLLEQAPAYRRTGTTDAAGTVGRGRCRSAGYSDPTRPARQIHRGSVSISCIGRFSSGRNRPQEFDPRRCAATGRSGPKPKNTEVEAFDVLRQVTLTPEMVRDYSYEFPHLTAHHDPEASAAIGMRAPIARS